MRLHLLFSICIFLICFGFVAANDLSVREIIDRAIDKKLSDESICNTYTSLKTTYMIKYDKHFRPEEIKEIQKRQYVSGDKHTEVVFSIKRDGKLLDRQDTEQEIRKMVEKWEKEQKKGKNQKHKSRHEYVDPLRKENQDAYHFEIIGTGDSVVGIAPSAVAMISDDTDSNRQILDQSVEILLTYYIIKVKSMIEDDQHVNGTLWLDDKSYGVLKAAYTLAKLPAFADRLDFEINYTTLEVEGVEIYLFKRVDLKGKTGFPFFKKQFGIINEYSEYERLDGIDVSVFNSRFVYKEKE